MIKLKPVAFMLVGVPGSGKSTWADPYIIKDGFQLISSDAYIEVMAQAMGSTYGEIFKSTIGEATKWMETEMNKAFAASQNLIWDQTNLSLKSRRDKLNKLLDAGYDVTAVAFEIPTKELEARRKARELVTGKSIPANICESMGKTYVRPTRLEGFKHVIIVTPEGEFEGG
jgi:predicted kinase